LNMKVIFLIFLVFLAEAAPSSNGWLNNQIIAYASGGAAQGWIKNVWPQLPYPNWVAFDLTAIPASQRANVRMFWQAQSADGQYDAMNAGGCYTFYSGVVGGYEIQTASGSSGTVPTSWTTVASQNSNTVSQLSWKLSLSASNSNWVRFVGHNRSSCEDPTWHDYLSGNFDFYNLNVPQDSGAGFLGDSITLLSGSHAMGDDGHGMYWSVAIQNLRATSDDLPMMINDGIGGTTSVRCNGDIDRIISVTPGKYIAVALGMNDAPANNPQGFQNNMATCIKKISAASKIPIIPTISYTAVPAYVNTVPQLNNEIKQLYTLYPQTLVGPDFYTYFQQRQYLLRNPTADVHPNTQGMQAIELLWENWFLVNVYGYTGNLYPDPNKPNTTAFVY